MIAGGIGELSPGLIALAAQCGVERSEVSEAETEFYPETMPPRTKQPDTVTADSVYHILDDNITCDAQQKAKNDGILFKYQYATVGARADKASAEVHAKLLLELLRLNPSGVFNKTLLYDALKRLVT